MRAFTRGIASPCAFYFRKRGTKVIVHGDDINLGRPMQHLEWMKRITNKNLESTLAMTAANDEMDNTMVVLNRKIAWHGAGVTYESIRKAMRQSHLCTRLTASEKSGHRSCERDRSICTWSSAAFSLESRENDGTPSKSRVLAETFLRQ